MTALAEACQVTVRFGSVTAADSVSFAVRRSEVVGVLGANGAGKTTMIRALLGLLTPTAGAALLFGSPPSPTARRRVGYLPQTLGLYSDLTVRENWQFSAEAFGTGRSPLPDSIAGHGSELVQDLPLGIQRRVAFAVAFAHQPELLVLDEPTSGVGPLGAARLWQDIRGSAEDGVGVLVSTHNMAEAEQCDRLVVMAAGAVAATGTVAEIIGSRQVTEVRSGDWRAAFALLDSARYIVQAHGELLRVSAPRRDVDKLLNAAELEASTRSVAANLEEAFVAIVTQDGAG